MSNLVKTFTWILSVVLILVGVAGFFTGDMLLVFKVDTMHNIVHLATGILGLAAISMGQSVARLFLIVFGIVYAVVAVLGFVSTDGTILGLITTNMADNYLHTAIALGCLGVGLTASKK
jgi:Domain of unknown function (DUF4383)